MNCSTPGLPPVPLPARSHGQRSLVGCSPWGRYELDDWTTLTFHFHALEKEMATHSSVLAWRIPGTGDPGKLLSVGSHRVEPNWSDLAVSAGLPVHHQLQEFTQTDVHRVMPSSHLILCRPLLLPPIPARIRVFSNETTLRMRWPKYFSSSS